MNTIMANSQYLINKSANNSHIKILTPLLVKAVKIS